MPRSVLTANSHLKSFEWIKVSVYYTEFIRYSDTPRYVASWKRRLYFIGLQISSVWLVIDVLDACQMNTWADTALKASKGLTPGKPEAWSSVAYTCEISLKFLFYLSFSVYFRFSTSSMFLSKQWSSAGSIKLVFQEDTSCISSAEPHPALLYPVALTHAAWPRTGQPIFFSCSFQVYKTM